MASKLYPTIFCSTLVLLAAIFFRPSTAQDLVNFARQVRGQAPDPGVPGYAPGSTPGIDPRVRAQFESIPQAATQPMPLRYPTPNQPGPNGAVPASYMPESAGGPPAKQLDSAVIVARVGGDAILASDLLGRYAIYQQAKAEGAPESALGPFRAEMQAELRNLADAKILFAEASKTIPPEALKDIEKKIDEQFEKTQLKELMQRTKSDNKQQLDARLREVGTSVERRRQSFFEMSVAKIWLQQNVKDEEIAYADVFAYYQNNLTKFDHEAVSRWEQLAALFANFTTKQEAWDAICQMGNDVLKGVPFAEVAKAHSQGPTASKGGERDWTTQGSLKSIQLDKVIFALPVGTMSQIIEDADGYHVIRVTERKDAYRTPFLEAQVDIKKQLTEEKLKKKNEAYLNKLRQQNPVWTIFDDQTPADGTKAAMP